MATWTIAYFIPIVFVGAFFLLNLTLAVIKSKFTEEMHKQKKQPGMSKKKAVVKKRKGVDDDSDPEDKDANQFQDETDEQRAQRERDRIEGMTL